MDNIESILQNKVFAKLGSLTKDNIITGEENHIRRTNFSPSLEESQYFHYHNTPEFCVCINGSVIIQVDKLFYLLKGGDMCLINRNIHHGEFPTAKNNNYEIVWFIFPSVHELLVVHLRNKRKKFEQLQSLHLDIDPVTVQYIDRLFEKQNFRVPQVVKLFKSIQKQNVTPPGNKKYYSFTDRSKNNYQVRRVLQALEFINDHYAEKITLERVAQHVNFNPEYFNRLFKKIIHNTFINYLNHKRLENAQRFMNGTNLTLAEISYRVGFNDPYYFSKVFRKLFGMSPRQFRDKYTNL